jgi:hypothetical protein
MLHKLGALGVISMAILVLVSQAALAGEVDGEWSFVFKTEIGDRTPTMTLTTEGDSVNAVAEGLDLAGTFKDGELELSGELFSPDAGYTSTLTVTGKLAGEALVGEWVWDVYTGPFTAERAE